MMELQSCCTGPDLKILCLILIIAMTHANVITIAPGGLNSHDISSSPYDCDGVGFFFCPTASGTCYTGYDGYVGCCSLSSCAARTTCYAHAPADLGTHPCSNVDTGGCIACSDDTPSCATILNAFNNQYIVYCASQATLQVTSYTNLVSTGSLALAPGQSIFASSTTASSRNLAPSITVSSTKISASPSSTVAATAATVSDGIVDGDIGVSKGVVAGITVGSVAGIMALIGLAFVIVRHRKRNRKIIPFDQYADQYVLNKPGEFGTAGSSNNKLRKPPESFVRPRATTVDASNVDEYLSPAVYDLLTRQSEAREAVSVHELDAHETGISAVASPDPKGQEKSNSWAPPTNTEAAEIARMSAKSAPARYRTYQPKKNPESRTSELPGSIRFVRPSGSQETLSSDSPPQESNTYILPPPRIIPQISPNPSTYDPSPLIGGVSPLLDRWHSGRASVGETSATVDGPLNWFSPLHVQSRSRSGDVGQGAGSPSAMGGVSRYVTPEEAMEFGYRAGNGEGKGGK